jgi:hypothetical protein
MKKGLSRTASSRSWLGNAPKCDQMLFYLLRGDPRIFDDLTKVPLQNQDLSVATSRCAARSVTFIAEVHLSRESAIRKNEIRCRQQNAGNPPCESDPKPVIGCRGVGDRQRESWIDSRRQHVRIKAKSRARQHRRNEYTRGEKCRERLPLYPDTHQYERN